MSKWTILNFSQLTTDMKINLWYSKSMGQWRWTLVEEWQNGVSHTEQHSGQQPFLRDAMEDVANTVEYILENK